MQRSLRSALTMLALTLAALSAGCFPEDPYIPTAPPVEVPNPAYLRIVHTAPEAPDATPMVGGKVFRGSVGYLSYRAGVNEAHYYPADTAARKIDFTVGGSVLASAPLDMRVGRYYTAYLHGRPGDYRVLVTEDTIRPDPGVSNIKLRIVNLAPDAPPLDFLLSTTPERPVAVNVAYGTASAYDFRPLAGLGRPAVTARVAGTMDTLMYFPHERFVFPGNVIFTLVLTGYHRPAAEQPMIAMAVFPENGYDADDRLFGGYPVRVEFAGIRLINIIATPTRTFDLTFYDQDYRDKFNNENQGFRRNYAGQDRVMRIPSLCSPTATVRGYFLQSLARSVFGYRLEWHTTDDTWLNEPVWTGVDTLTVEANKRITVVGYGPDVPDSTGAPNVARSTWMRDNVPPPSSAGLTRLRFFHGSFGPLQSERLRLRVAGMLSPAMGYGEPPTAAQAIEVGAGTVTVEILDEEGNVVHSAQHSFTGGETYTVFFFPGCDGATPTTRPVGDAIDAT